MPDVMDRVREGARTGRITEATAERILVDLITPGQGSSGYYTPELLEQAATDRVFPAGTFMFIDHPSRAEDRDRPERSVRDIAAVLLEDAVWTGSALQAPARVYGGWQALVTDGWQDMGVSIRCAAELGHGDIDGKPAKLVTRLLPDVFNSVDFVTYPGRGGRVTALLEAARVDEISLRGQLTALRDALVDVYGSDDWYLEVIDADPEQGLVWWKLYDREGSESTWQQSYTMSPEGAVSLEGDAVQVQQHTEYRPMPQEGTMPQIDQAELDALRADAARAEQAERDRDAARARADSLLEAANAGAAAAVLAQAAPGVEWTAIERAGLAASRTFLDDGRLDEAAFRSQVESAVKDRPAPHIGGGVQGHGAPADARETGASSLADLDRLLGIGGAR